LDINGDVVSTILNDTLIAVNIKQLKKAPLTIGIAFGHEKTKAIRACLKNGFIDSLITDAGTAQTLLEE